MFRNALGDLTNKTAVSVAQQSAQGYGSGAAAAEPPIAHRPAPGAPDSASTSRPDSTSAAYRSPFLGLLRAAEGVSSLNFNSALGHV